MYFQCLSVCGSITAIHQLFVCFEVNFLATYSYTHCFFLSLSLWDAPPCFILEPAVELEAEWMALCDLAVVPVKKVCFSPYPSTLCGTGMTTIRNNGQNNSMSCYDIMQRSPISVFWAARPSDKMSTILTRQPEQLEPKNENQQTRSCLSGGHARSSYNARFKSVLAMKGTHYKAHEISLALSPQRWSVQMTAVPTKPGGRVCVPVDLGVLVTEARKQKTLPNHMAGRLPALNWLESLELDWGMGWGGAVFLESWESSYAWIRLHPGCTTRRSESDWHFMGAYCSHPVCQSKPLECFFLALQPVFIFLWGATLL